MIDTQNTFENEILVGIPEVLPVKKEYDKNVNHAPKRKNFNFRRKEIST